jgi:hypothetical protein
MEECRRFIGDSSECNALTFVSKSATDDHEGSLLLSAGFLNGCVMLWDVESGELVVRWRAHEVGIITLLSLKERELWSHGRDGWCYRWDLGAVDDKPPSSPTHVICTGYASFCRVSAFILPDGPFLREILVGAALKTEELEVWRVGTDGSHAAVELACKVEPPSGGAKRGMTTATELFKASLGAAAKKPSRPLRGAFASSSSPLFAEEGTKEHLLLAASYESGHIDVRNLQAVSEGSSSSSSSEQAELVLSVDVVTTAPILSFSMLSPSATTTDASDVESSRPWMALVTSADASVAILSLDFQRREGSVLRKLVVPCKGSLYQTVVFHDHRRGGRPCGAYGGRDGVLRVIDMETGEEVAGSSGGAGGGSTINCLATTTTEEGDIVLASGYKSAPISMWQFYSDGVGS